MYVRPGASGAPVGRPVLVGNGAPRDVVARGSGLVTIVAMSNAIAMGPAVAIRVRSPSLVGVIAASHPADAAP